MKENKKDCKSCGKITGSQWYMFVISLYILFSSIYGTVLIVKKLMSFF
jgi:hypothetical protein